VFGTNSRSQSQLRLLFRIPLHQHRGQIVARPQGLTHIRVSLCLIIDNSNLLQAAPTPRREVIRGTSGYWERLDSSEYIFTCQALITAHCAKAILSGKEQFVSSSSEKEECFQCCGLSLPARHRTIMASATHSVL
jgi:hypothetical protein